MSDFQTKGEVQALVDAAGGPSALARELGFTRQRVGMWCFKGAIPAMVVLAFRPVFKRILVRGAKREAA